MALNLATLKTRAITAVVFVVVMLGGIMWNAWSYDTLFLLIQIGCVFELIRLIRLMDPMYNRFPLPGFKYLVLGLVYLTLPFMAMRYFYRHGTDYFNGPEWTLSMILIASIWINDTMAYLVGSLIGKTPLSPISPKKTWEGTAGGALLAVVVVTAGAHLIWNFPILPLVLISATAAVTGTLGDLLESKLKRTAGVKDSGQIMPGHGGFLDRFDSLLIAAPAVWLVLYLLRYTFAVQ